MQRYNFDVVYRKLYIVPLIPELNVHVRDSETKAVIIRRSEIAQGIDLDNKFQGHRSR